MPDMEIRRARKNGFGHCWYGAAIVTLGLILVGQALALVWSSLFPLTDKTGFPVAVRTYLSEIWLWPLFLLMMQNDPADREALRRLNPKGQGKRALIGAGIGLGLNALCWLAAWANKDLIPVWMGAEVWQLLVLLPVVLIQSGAEEIAFRSFLLERCRKDLKRPWMAVVLNGVLFGALHLANEHVTVIGFLATAALGMLLAVMYVCMDSPVPGILMHTMWNYTQNILLGMPNSGWIFSCSALGVSATQENASFFYDPYFGIEGGAFCVAVALLCTGAFAMKNRNKQSGER